MFLRTGIMATIDISFQSQEVSSNLTIFVGKKKGKNAFLIGKNIINIFPIY